MSSEYKQIEKQAIFSGAAHLENAVTAGASHFCNGIAAGALLFQQGLLRGAQMMAASDDPLKLLEKLKPPVVFAKDKPSDETKLHSDDQRPVDNESSRRRGQADALTYIDGWISHHLSDTHITEAYSAALEDIRVHVRASLQRLENGRTMESLTSR